MLRVFALFAAALALECIPDNEEADALTIGSRTMICVSINEEFRTVFYPVVDNFGLMMVSDCASFIRRVAEFYVR